MRTEFTGLQSFYAAVFHYWPDTIFGKVYSQDLGKSRFAKTLRFDADRLALSETLGKS
ncbi:hypothetical protein ES708_34061 [subsurface metagenome]